MLKYLLALLSIGIYFISPLSYIYFHMLRDNATERNSFIGIAIFSIVLSIVIFILTKVLFKIKKLYYIKLLIVTVETLGILWIGLTFFNYISFNATDISDFLLFTMITTMIGTIPTLVLIHRLKKEKIL